MTPLWTILIPTIGRRGDMFTRLMEGLLPQTEPYFGRVSVLALWNNGELPLPQIRDKMMDTALSEYTSFVDDDDELPPYYVEQVVPLLDGVDYVGWRMQMWDRGRKLPPTYHSLNYGGWGGIPDTCFYRDVSHLNPVRRQLALAHARFSTPGKWTYEDTNWADMLRGHLRTEHCVPEEYCMYMYHRTGDASWMGFTPPAPGLFTRPAIEHPNFTWMELLWSGRGNRSAGSGGPCRSMMWGMCSAPSC